MKKSNFLLNKLELLSEIILIAIILFTIAFSFKWSELNYNNKTFDVLVSKTSTVQTKSYQKYIRSHSKLDLDPRGAGHLVPGGTDYLVPRGTDHLVPRGTHHLGKGSRARLFILSSQKQMGRARTRVRNVSNRIGCPSSPQAGLLST